MRTLKEILEEKGKAPRDVESVLKGIDYSQVKVLQPSTDGIRHYE